VVFAKSALLFWEQPRGSLMESHPRFQEMMQKFRLFRHHTKLWDFGGASEKALWMYSQKPWVVELDRYCIARDRFWS
jgi:hypothetical protein